jgi:mono/diheme cytochrome c family protein
MMASRFTIVTPTDVNDNDRRACGLPPVTYSVPAQRGYAMPQLVCILILIGAVSTGGAAQMLPQRNQHLSETPAQAVRIEEGHRLALELCSVCHIVASDQIGAPVLRNPGPPFRDIANSPDTTRASLRTILTTTHSSSTPPFAMPNPHLTEGQLQDVVGYILSMRDHS